MQRFYCIGNITRKPEYYETQNGNGISKFCVAVNRPFNKTETDYFNIVTWNGLADSCQKHLDKGSKVAILGHIETRSYVDTNGNKRFITEVIAQEVEFLSPSLVGKTETPKDKEQQELEQQFLPF